MLERWFNLNFARYGNCNSFMCGERGKEGFEL